MYDVFTLEVQDLRKEGGGRSWTEQTVQVPKPDFCTLMNVVQDQNRLAKDLAIAIFEAVKANHIANRGIRYNQDEHLVRVNDMRVRLAVLQASNTKMMAKISSQELTIRELAKSMSDMFKALLPIFQSDLRLVQEERPNHPLPPIRADMFDEALRVANMAVEDEVVQSQEERADIADCIRDRNEAQARLDQHGQEQVTPAVPERVVEIQRTKPRMTDDVAPLRSKWEKCADRVTALRKEGFTVTNVKNTKYAHTEYKKARLSSEGSTPADAAANDEGAGPSGAQSKPPAKTKTKTKTPETNPDDEAVDMEYSEFSQESDGQTGPQKPKTTKKTVTTTKVKTTDPSKIKSAKNKRQAMSEEGEDKDEDNETTKNKKKRKKASPQVESSNKKPNRRDKDDDDDASTSSASSAASMRRASTRIAGKRGQNTTSSSTGGSSSKTDTKTKKASLNLEDLPDPVPATPRRTPGGLLVERHVNRIVSPPPRPASRRPDFDSINGTRNRIATLKDTLEHHHRQMRATFEEMDDHLKSDRQDLYEKAKQDYDRQRLTADDLRHKLMEIKGDFRDKLEQRRQEKGVEYGNIPVWDLTGDEDDLEPKDEPLDEPLERTVIDSSVKYGNEWSAESPPPPPGGYGFVQREGEFSLNALMGAASVCNTPIVVRNINYRGADYLHVYRLESDSLDNNANEASVASSSPPKQSTPKT